MARLKRWWRQIRCKHTRMVEFYPADVTWWCSLPGGGSGQHRTIAVKGCLNCHRVWIGDFAE